jgi:hypothetical protein
LLAEIRRLKELAEKKLPQLIGLVVQLRAAQKAYFPTHGGLDDCKRIEREVDRWLYAEQHQARAVQTELFEVPPVG